LTEVSALLQPAVCAQWSRMLAVRGSRAQREIVDAPLERALSARSRSATRTVVLASATQRVVTAARDVARVTERHGRVTSRRARRGCAASCQENPDRIRTGVRATMRGLSRDRGRATALIVWAADERRCRRSKCVRLPRGHASDRSEWPTDLEPPRAGRRFWLQPLGTSSGRSVASSVCSVPSGCSQSSSTGRREEPGRTEKRSALRPR
jgi:hypothetical protein